MNNIELKRAAENLNKVAAKIEKNHREMAKRGAINLHKIVKGLKRKFPF